MNENRDPRENPQEGDILDQKWLDHSKAMKQVVVDSVNENSIIYHVRDGERNGVPLKMSLDCWHKQAYKEFDGWIIKGKKRNEKKSTFADAFETMSSKVHETAREKGWWSNERVFGEAIALMHSELSEALEAERRKNKDGEESEKIPGFTKVEEELADVVIRIMDWAKAKKLRVGEALEAKNEYNKTRTWKHGGKAF